MSDGLSGVGSAPFNVQSDIHQQTQSRERIEAHVEAQRVDKEHRLTHLRESDLRELQEKQRAATYPSNGQILPGKLPQGLVVDKEI
mgnify:CR=1 FL=1